jgi:hypothetical protein
MQQIRRRRWTAEEDDFLITNYESMTAGEIAARLDRTEDSVWIRARLHGLDKRGVVRPWTEDELEELRCSYGTVRPAVLAEKFGRTTSAVSQQARVLGLISAKALIPQTAVHDYFSDVRTAEQAYLLGLLAADGNVSARHPRVTFGLQAKDAAVVELMRDRLCPGANVWRSPRDGFAQLQITSAQIVTDVAQYSIVPRKSRTLKWPRQLGELQRPFLLGYFDGDGSAYLVRRQTRIYPGWTVCSGSEALLIRLKEYVLEAAGIALQKIQHRPNSDLYQVAVLGRGAFVIDDWLHQDGLGMSRKRYPDEVVERYRRLLGSRTASLSVVDVSPDQPQEPGAGSASR